MAVDTQGGGLISLTAQTMHGKGVPSLGVSGLEVKLNWGLPDKDASYNQTLIYRATSKYGSFTLISTQSDIRTIKYLDSSGTPTSWYKIRFYDFANAIYSNYSQSVQASSTIGDTNYTTPKLVAQYLGAYRKMVSTSIGTANGTTVNFSLTAPDNLPIADTETIYLGTNTLQRNVDYSMNYDDGIAQFASAPVSGAITGDWWSSTFANNSQFIKVIRRAEDDINRRTGRTFYQPQTISEVIDSFDPLDTSQFAFEAKDFTTDARQYKSQTSEFLTSRVVQLEHYPITAVNQVILNAQPTNASAEAVGTGDGIVTAYTLDYYPVVYGSEIIYVAGVSVTNYIINYTTGAITFTGTPPTGAITADYTYCSSGTVLTADQYLRRDSYGVILFKNVAGQIQKNLSIATIVYDYGFYEVPPIVEDLATRIAAINLIQTTQMASTSPLAISDQNIGMMLGEIRSLFDSLGRKLILTRL